MAQKRLHIGIGRRRLSRKTQSASSIAYTQSMRASADAIVSDMLSILDQFEGVTPEIMMTALEPTFDKAIRYTPVMTGELVESAYLEQTSFRGKPRVEMGFAKGGKPAYAVYVHEITEYSHEHPTRAKFLESALFEDLDDIYQRLGRQYQAFMGTGGR